MLRSDAQMLEKRFKVERPCMVVPCVSIWIIVIYGPVAYLSSKYTARGDLTLFFRLLTINVDLRVFQRMQHSILSKLHWQHPFKIPLDKASRGWYYFFIKWDHNKFSQS